MKLSQIKQIIKEEVAKAVSEIDKNRELNDKFAAAVGFKAPAPGGPENVQGLPLEKLPDYAQLPDTRDDAMEMIMAKKIIKKLLLPSEADSNARQVISSKEEAQEWVKKFTNKWMDPGADKIRFSFNEIGNPVVINAKKDYYEWAGISARAAQEFYDEPTKYKGD